MSNLTHLLNQIDADLKTGELIDPKVWIDRGIRLGQHREEEAIRLAELDVELGKVVERIKVEMAEKGEKVADNAAKNKAKLDPAWLTFKRQEAHLQRIDSLMTSCNKHSSRLY